MKMERNEQLREAWEFVENTGTSIFLTGKAGTGKTTFLKTVVEKSKKRLIVVAPTGVAAINAGGVTIHSFFQLPLSPFVPGTQTKNKFDFGKEKRKMKTLLFAFALGYGEILVILLILGIKYYAKGLKSYIRWNKNVWNYGLGED